MSPVKPCLLAIFLALVQTACPRPGKLPPTQPPRGPVDAGAGELPAVMASAPASPVAAPVVNPPGEHVDESSGDRE